MITLEKKDIKYPKLLKTIKKSPCMLYAEGNVDILNDNCITVIGSRNMSDYGRKVTKKIVKDLTLNGLCIVSGMAVGIDTVAHKTCLENNGKTIAVLGSGLNRVYPEENKALYSEIINRGGCVISEYSPDVSAQKHFFVERNRIVSGLSLATLVIEASYRSGTSITANCALNQGRKLFCIPNSIGNKNSAGILNWLKKGAKLVTNAYEILDELKLKKLDCNFDEDELNVIENERFVENAEKQELKEQEDIVKNIYFYIKEHGIVNVEVLSSEFKVEIYKVNAYLAILELKGLIVDCNGLNYRVSDKFYV